jgi:hypothetical protein
MEPKMASMRSMRAAHRVQAARAALAAGQRHVERLGLQLGLSSASASASRRAGQRGLDALLGLVDLGAAGLLLLGRRAARPFSSSVTRPDLPRNGPWRSPARPVWRCAKSAARPASPG